MSRIWNGSSSIIFAISLMIFGSEPKSCNDTGYSSGWIASNTLVFLFLYCRAFALIISMHKSPAPCSLQSNLNGRSVTPAIGARIYGFARLTFPIFIFLLLLINFNYYYLLSWLSLNNLQTSSIFDYSRILIILLTIILHFLQETHSTIYQLR